MINKKTIIFDFGGVLGSDADEWTKSFKRIPEMTGLNPDELQDIWRRHWKEVKIGKKELRAVFEDMAMHSKKRVAVSSLEEAYIKGISINQKVLDFAKEIKQKGFDTAILANESKQAMEEKIKRFGLNRLFSKIYCSADLGMAKPNKDIFEYALKDLGKKEQDVIFIDNQEINVEMANSLGIKTIHFKGIGQLKKELTKML